MADELAQLFAQQQLANQVSGGRPAVAANPLSQAVAGIAQAASGVTAPMGAREAILMQRNRNAVMRQLVDYGLSPQDEQFYQIGSQLLGQAGDYEGMLAMEGQRQQFQDRARSMRFEDEDRQQTRDDALFERRFKDRQQDETETARRADDARADRRLNLEERINRRQELRDQRDYDLAMYEIGQKLLGNSPEAEKEIAEQQERARELTQEGDRALRSVDAVLSVLAEASQMPGFLDIYGAENRFGIDLPFGLPRVGAGVLADTFSGPRQDAEAARENLVAQLELASAGKLKGQGQVSEGERKILRNAATQLSNRKITPQRAAKLLNDLAQEYYGQRRDVLQQYRRKDAPEPPVIQSFGGVPVNEIPVRRLD